MATDGSRYSMKTGTCIMCESREDVVVQMTYDRDRFGDVHRVRANVCGECRTWIADRLIMSKAPK